MLLTTLLISGTALYGALKIYKKHNSALPSKVLSSFSGIRRQQITEMSSNADKDKDIHAEKEINRDLSIAISSLGFAGGSYLISPSLGLISLLGNIYLTIPSVKVAYSSLKDERTVNIDTLSVITMAIGLGMHYYVWCSIANILYVTSKKLLIKIKDDSQNSLIDVFKNRPRSVWILINGVEIQKPFTALKTGDIVVIGAGETIPADGHVTDGMGSVDQHILTGESQPVEKAQGDEVFAATVVLMGKIYIQVLKTGEETTVEQIGQLLNRTAHFKTSLQLRAETLTDKTVLPTLIVGILSLPFIGPMGTAALLNAHFGYRMLVIAPIGILNFFHMMSQKGLLVKDGRILELLGKIDTLVFDKTGTLTENQPQVGKIHLCGEYEEDDILAIAAAAEHKQTHPVALAILKEAQMRALVIPPTEEVEYKVGYGIKVIIEKRLIRVGSLRFMETEDIKIPSVIQQQITDWQKAGNSVIMVAVDNNLIGVIELVPTIRPDAKATIQALKKRQIKSVYIISGDHEIPTRKLAESLGVDDYFAETLPQNKADIIKQLQAAGKMVCYVGDGINDAIALKQANVSVSLRGASTAATDTAQVILMHEKLEQLCQLFEFSQDFESNLKTSFAAILLPSFIGGFGAFFMHFTIIQTILLKQVGLVAGLTNTMLPLMKHKPDKETKPSGVQSLVWQSSKTPKPPGVQNRPESKL
jgi:heavy metal translocating P-type ATPase